MMIRSKGKSKDKSKDRWESKWKRDNGNSNRRRLTKFIASTEIPNMANDAAQWYNVH